MAALTTRPTFGSVETTFADGETSSAQGRDDVESPSLSSSNALARFEFEPGRSKEGTKVLMVEWQEDDSSRAVHGDWEISWDDKRTVLPAKDPKQSQQQGEGRTPSTAPAEEQPVNRMYFLLLPGMPIPTTVRLHKGTGASAINWRTNPLPAIYAPELGATALEAGKKGVLHTHWAKKRLQALQMEIEQESRDHTEGIGLQMALAEKEWIEANFGVTARPSTSTTGRGPGNISINTSISSQPHFTNDLTLHSPSSPRSPGPGRLMEKLKGLKLGTSEKELSSPLASTSSVADDHNPLSPENSDVAVGGGTSFGSFLALKGAPPTQDLASKPPQQPRKIVAARPPEALGRASNGGGIASLDAAFSEIPFRSMPQNTNGTGSKGNEDEDDDDLFALPMSPRSPEMTKSPFSFAAQDIGRYVAASEKA